MFAYYLNLAVRSFKRNKVLTALMVLAIALGIGASMTTLTVFRVLSGDPIPQKSSQLFYPRMDPQGKGDFTPGDEPEEQMTRFDAEALLRAKRGDRQVMMSGGSVAVQADGTQLDPFRVDARYTSADFFAMFDAPFKSGNGWTAADDVARARVAVISQELDTKLFNGGSAVGKTIRFNGESFRIIGVLNAWRPTPHFYDLTNDRFGGVEQVFLPMSTSLDLHMDTQGNVNCWGDSDGVDSADLNAPCAWIQYWVQLDTPAKAAAFKRYLTDYSDQQRAAGRFERPTNVRLHGLMEWLDVKHVVPADVRLQVWLAFGFLLVCLLNTVGLLLAKFLRRSSEIGVRRALGASRRAIFAQCLVEAGTIGLAGGVLGLGFAMLGLWAVRQQPAGYAELAHIDPAMLLLTFGLSILASLLAGVLPAWRACQVAPAIQLKTQ